jgi:GNAT superfamily N-acetyltransferase
MKAATVSEPGMRRRSRGRVRASGTFAVRALERFVSIRNVILLECPLAARKTQRMAVDDLSFFWATLGDLESLKDLELVSTDETRHATGTRFARGDRCAVGTHCGSAATYLWISFSRRELPRGSWPVGDGSVFFSKTFTLPKYRSRGFNRAAISWALDRCQSEGLLRAFTDVNASNHSSLRAIRSAGFNEIGRFRECRVGRRTFTLLPANLYRRVADAHVTGPRMKRAGA